MILYVICITCLSVSTTELFCHIHLLELCHGTDTSLCRRIQPNTTGKFVHDLKKKKSEVINLCMISKAVHLRVFRLHKKTIDDACRRLEEYKRRLKMRYAPVTMAAVQTPAPSANVDAVCSFPSLPHRTLSTAITRHLNTDISPEAAALDREQSYHSTVFTDPTLLIQPPPSLVITTSCVKPQPLSTPIRTSHSVHEDGMAGIPHPAASSVSDKRLSDETSAHHDVPLLPPAVFLEYLLSKRSQAPPTHLTSISQQVSKVPGSVLQNEVENIHPCQGTETETNQQVREQIRKQRDALHTLLGAHAKVTRIGENRIRQGIICVQG